jgi:hypothetical protein
MPIRTKNVMLPVLWDVMHLTLFKLSLATKRKNDIYLHYKPSAVEICITFKRSVMVF